MSVELAAAAAIGCAVCNAAAAVLQKVSSDKVAPIHTFNAGTITSLLRKLPYVAGMVLDLLAGVCTLVAVSKLPLFIVQAVIACCVVLTAFLERLFLKRRLSGRIYGAAAVVLLGLSCLAFASHSESRAVVSTLVRNGVLLAPLVLAGLGALAMRASGKTSTFLLGALSGCGFGGVSVVGRLLVYPHPFWLVVRNPLLWVLILYGALGLFLFTAALQRTYATVVNGVMTSAQTLAPLLVGILLLGDTARDGLWYLVWVGCAWVVAGCAYIAFSEGVGA